MRDDCCLRWPMSLVCRADNALHNRGRTWAWVCNFHDWWITK